MGKNFVGTARDGDDGEHPWGWVEVSPSRLLVAFGMPKVVDFVCFLQSKLPQSVLSKSLVGSSAVLGDDNDSLGYSPELHFFFIDSSLSVLCILP